MRRGRNILAGPLMYPPTDSMTKPLLVLRVGDFNVALHPTADVLVIPDGGKAVITVTPRSTPVKPEPPNQGVSGAIGDAINGERTMNLLPGRWRNRRRCLCGCGGKRSHGGYAGGIAMVSGCEWAMRYWVSHGQLPTNPGANNQPKAANTIAGQ